MSSKSGDKKRGAASASSSSDQPAAKKQRNNAADNTPQPASKSKKSQGKKQKSSQKEEHPDDDEEEVNDDGEDDDDDDNDDGNGGPVDEAGLEAVSSLEPKMQLLITEIEGVDESMNRDLFQVKKRYALKKRPILKKRDELISQVPLIWKKLFTQHETINMQLDEIDLTILEQLTKIEVDEVFAKENDEKQQIIAVDITFTFIEGKDAKNSLIKPGKYTKQFKYNDESEEVEAVMNKSTISPFTPSFAKLYPESFFLAWFNAEGTDEGILAAQDAITSELYVDPLQLFRMVCEGKSLNPADDDDDEEDAEAMRAFGEEGEEDEDDDDAPELVDDQ